jgi:hypothetical protein
MNRFSAADELQAPGDGDASTQAVKRSSITSGLSNSTVEDVQEHIHMQLLKRARRIQSPSSEVITLAQGVTHAEVQVLEVELTADRLREFNRGGETYEHTQVKRKLEEQLDLNPTKR